MHFILNTVNPHAYVLWKRQLAALLCCGLCATLFGFPDTTYAQGSREDYERAQALAGRVADKVKPSPKLQWISEQAAWFAEQNASGRRTMIFEGGEVRAAFDHERMAQAINAVSKGKQDASQLAVDWLSMSPDKQTLHVSIAGKVWQVALGDYSLEPSDEKKPDDLPERKTRSQGYPRQEASSNAKSPDGRWTVEIRDNNVHLRQDGDKTLVELSKDGSADDAFQQRCFWSPDSKKLIVMRQRRGQEHPVHMVESSPKGQLQPKLFSHQYLKPGDKIAQDRPQLFDIEHKWQIALDESLYSNPWSIRRMHWSKDSRRFTFLYNQRGHQRLRLVTIQADTGESGTLLDETSDTFLDYAHKEWTYYLDDSNEILWLSERDGWNHIYLLNANTGDVKHQVTKGQWVVRSVDRVDPKRRQIWFFAGGVYPAQDPYYLHYCRIDFDGSNFTLLTSGNGTHEVAWSPGDRFLVARYSRVDMPTVTELRDPESGRLVRELHKADWKPLLETGWKAPERLVFKGRDGKTDIYGVLFRPTNFDPAKKYPVIESIYAGPHAAFCPKHFRSYYREQSLAELGFIVVKMDGMGTSHRSKAFHDVCSRNLGDSGFPDRIRWIKAAAKKYPWMDLERVGIYGGSAGGQSATRAVLAHGDFYHVAVSDCGCHDNRMDKIWWNELWMGWPIGPHYAEQSNVTQAHRLQGKLLLIVGEMDKNVDPASTLQVVNALIKADKDFDMLLVPGGGHGIAESPYGTRRRRDFLVRHLLGVEPRHE